jgi:DNA-binding response OmpR family regulator
MKVMICEENQDKAKVIEDLLNVYKFKVITLTESLNFIKKVQTHKPAVVIINEKFMKKPGNVMLNQLRTNPVGAKTPVIYISEENNVEKVLNNFSGDSLLELMQEPYKIKHLRHFIDRWTLFRSLHLRHESN